MQSHDTDRFWPPISRRSLIGAGAAGFGLLAAGCQVKPASAPTVPANPFAPWVPGPDDTALASDAAPIDQFFPPDFQRDHTDAAPVLEEAARWSSKTGRQVRIDGKLYLRRTARIDAEDTQFYFDNASIEMDDAITRVLTGYGKAFPIGLHILADGAALLGHCHLFGNGVPGETYLQGLYADEVSGLRIERFTLGNLAVGLHFMCCEEVTCGPTRSYSMWGLQGAPESPNGAGTAQAISGCLNSNFGPLIALETDKPARYLAVGKFNQVRFRDNIGNRYGKVVATARPGSPWMQVTGIRSSVDSVFAGGEGTATNLLLNIQKYATDDPYQITGNDFGHWAGSVRDEPTSSLDAGFNVYVEDGAKGVGKNRIRSMDLAIDPVEPNFLQRRGFRLPHTYGVWCNSGEWEIDRLALRGFARGLHLEQCRFNIGELSLDAIGYVALRLGDAVSGRIESARLVSDLAFAGDGDPFVEHFGKQGSACGNDGLRVDRLEHASSASGERLWLGDACT